MLYSFVTLFSLFETCVVIPLCLLVLRRWHQEYVNYCQTDSRRPSQLLIAGVYIGFVGSVGDNAWWGLAWAFDYLGIEALRDFFFKYGVYSNVVFRQGAIVWAALLHIHADTMSRQTLTERIVYFNEARNYIIVSAAIGIAFVFLLISLRGV